MYEVSNNPNRIMRMREVCQVVGLSRATLYRLQKLGRFPHSIQLSYSAVGWKANTIALWLTEREIESAPAEYTIQ